VGAAHAGWKGAKGGVLESVVSAMEGLGAERSRIRATVGPAISQASYEVGAEIEAAFIADDPSHKQYFRPGPSGQPHFDLPAYCLARLQDAGVAEASVLPHCTYASESRFFSFRRTTHRGEGDYGRQISAILVL
ncbi:MAG: laccase domain-containing protein, partial [Alphaproteobacteria bacterium]